MQLTTTYKWAWVLGLIGALAIGLFSFSSMAFAAGNDDGDKYHGMSDSDWNDKMGWNMDWDRMCKDGNNAWYRDDDDSWFIMSYHNDAWLSDMGQMMWRGDDESDSWQSCDDMDGWNSWMDKDESRGHKSDWSYGHGMDNNNWDDNNSDDWKNNDKKDNDKHGHDDWSSGDKEDWNSKDNRDDDKNWDKDNSHNGDDWNKDDDDNEKDRNDNDKDDDWSKGGDNKDWSKGLGAGIKSVLDVGLKLGH